MNNINRLKVSVMLILLWFFTSISYAASIGNPIKPVGHMKLAVGADANFLFDRDMELNGNSTTGAAFSGFQLSKLTEGDTKLILGITDYVNIFARLGISRINSLEIKLSTGEDISIETDNAFSYGLGANAVYQISSDELYFTDIDSDFVCFFGIGGEFNFFNTDATEVYVSGVNVVNTSGQIESRQYQVSIFGGIEFILDENFSLIPYIAGFWNTQNIKTGKLNYSNGDHISFDSDADNSFGFALGLDLKLSDNVGVNIEAKFLDAHAISAGGTIKF